MASKITTSRVNIQRHYRLNYNIRYTLSNYHHYLSKGKVLKNIQTNEYIMKVMGVNIDNFIEVPIEEYENWKLENNSKDNKTVI